MLSMVRRARTAYVVDVVEVSVGGDVVGDVEVGEELHE
jgi:hypothetical protein